MPMSRQERQPLTVHEAVSLAKGAVDGLPTLLVTGEVSGFRGPNARSGHCYFKVKDDDSSMDVIVWRSTFRQLDFDLRDGLQLELSGKFNVYEAGGKLSFIARSVSVAGEGLLRQQVAALARKLEREGLMAPERKRPIPRFCTRVAVCTSLSGEVIDDVKRTLRRRNPLVELDVVGCSVQGPGAPQTIERALQVAAAARPDAILLVRGGGSFEDLMTFNDEGLARAVAACPVPVITGIGHEPDTSICDMVSDRRCSTPTAAAESVAPALDEIVQAIVGRRQRLGSAMRQQVQHKEVQVDSLGDSQSKAMDRLLAGERLRVDALSQHRCLQGPTWMLQDRSDQLAQSEQRLHDAMPRIIGRSERDVSREAVRLDGAARRMLRPFEASLGKSAASLEALSPLKVLSRGYAITRDGNGHVVTRAESLSVGDSIDVRLAEGEVRAQVTGVTAHNQDDSIR